MKIQILISKSSWANKFEIFIKRKLKRFSKNIKIFDHHNKLKNNYDVNIIFSYFKKIPKNILKKSKLNLVPHESDLPSGKGMSPLTWQIIKNKKEVVFSLIEASSVIDGGKIYYKKKIKIPKHLLFEDIKRIQLKQNLLLIEKFLIFIKKKKENHPQKKIVLEKVHFLKEENQKTAN